MPSAGTKKKTMLTLTSVGDFSCDQAVHASLDVHELDNSKPAAISRVEVETVTQAAPVVGTQYR